MLLACVPTSASSVPSQPPSATPADTVRDCPGNRKLGDTGVYYGDLSVRNMTCGLGRNLLRRATLSDSGTPRIPGYRCRLIGTYPDGGIYRCTRKSRALRFEAGG